jgi:lysophospholipase L1-like esterase
MVGRRWARRLALLAVMAVMGAGYAVAFAAPASATHFRFRDMTWRYDHALADGAGNVVELTMRIADRRSFYGSLNVGSSFSAGVSTGDGGYENLNGEVVAVNAVDDWFIAEVRGFHTYTGVGPYTVSWESCCTLSSLRNSPDSWLRTTTVVDMVDGNRSSPMSLVSPIVHLPAADSVQTFRIPATDADGDNVHFRLATQSESRVTQPPGLSIDSRTGVVSWDTTGRLNGLWMVTLVLSDGPASTMNTFLINLGGTASAPPTWVFPTPADRSNISAEVGTSRTFTVAAVDPDGDAVHITPLNAPAGLSCTPASSSGRADLTCVWAPTTTGSHLVAFDAQDATGASAGLRSYRVTGPRYVAFGDSYSSGEGALDADNYEDNTDKDTGGNGCRRASTAYPHLVAGDAWTPDSLDFVACSGARTWHFVEAQAPDHENVQDAQFEEAQLSTDVELVTLTIGGNDAGFSEVIKKCIAGTIFSITCSSIPQISEHPVQDAFARLRGEEPPHGGGNEKTRPLSEIYSRILEEAPRARVLVVGYPQFFRDGGTFLLPCSGVSKTDQQWTNDKVAEMNALLEEEAHNLGLEFVPVSDAFDGHRLCEIGGGEDREWFRDLQFDAAKEFADPASFHPDDDGHVAIAQEVLGVHANPPAAIHMTTGQRETRQIIVDALQDLLSVFARWPGSDVEITLTSPSGVRYHRSAVPAGAKHLLGPTYEIFQVPNPEPGAWTVEYFGADLGADGEPVTIGSNQQAGWNAPPTPVLGHRMDGSTLHLDAAGSFDSDGDAIVEHHWFIADQTGIVAELTGPVVEHTFDNAGDYTVSLRVRDARGKHGYAGLDQVLTVASVYEVAGPEAPLASDRATWNEVNAGRTLPVKWRLTQDGVPVSEPASFTGLSSREVACESGAGDAAPVAGETAGSSGLSYTGDGGWLFTWQTDKAWAGTCRLMTVSFDDGSTMTARLSFR